MNVWVYICCECHCCVIGIKRFCKNLRTEELYTNRHYVPYCLGMAHCNTVMAIKLHSSYGTILFDHLAADGAGFAGSQVAVVAVGQVNADLLSGKCLETVHGLTGLENAQLVVI